MLKEAAALLGQVKAERIRMEFFKLLDLPHAAPWLAYLDKLGILTRLFPELEPARTCDQPFFHFLPVLGHLLEAVNCVEWLVEGFITPDSSNPHEVTLPPGVAPQAALPVAVQEYPDLPRDLLHSDLLALHFEAQHFSGASRAALFKLATLLHDNAKPQTRKVKPEGGVSFYDHQIIGAEVAQNVGLRMRLSRREVAYIKQVVLHHMRLGQLRTGGETTPRAVHRFFHATDDAALDVLLHDLADHLSARGPTIVREEWEAHIQWTNAMLDALWSKPPARQTPLINGHDLIATLGIAPGPLVGKLLDELREAQAAGEVTSREAALALAERLVGQEGQGE
jgi:poly(A) polymerase/tRNA nucleotidyltransferase (CCA-adding enzyme)